MPDKRIILHNPDRHPQYFANQPKGTPVGWCNHNKHRGKLSVKLMKQHKCLAKECPYFTKNEKHQYWEDRERIKKIKKAKKKKEIVMTICEKCEYMYHMEGKTVRYCCYEDAGKVKHYYCSTRNPANRCSHFKEIQNNKEESGSNGMET